VCTHCQTGSLLLRRVTFAAWYENHFITVPNFPAWVCDVCAACEYDAQALEQLEAVLGPEANLRREAARGPRREGAPALLVPRFNGRRMV
jgi:YgiT-type zinc finger domain-containing protein